MKWWIKVLFYFVKEEASIDDASLTCTYFKKLFNHTYIIRKVIIPPYHYGCRCVFLPMTGEIATYGCICKGNSLFVDTRINK